MGLAAISYKEQLGGFKRPEQRATGTYYLAHVTLGKVFRIIPEFRSAVGHWKSVRLWVKGLLVQDSLEAQCCVLEQDTLSSA